MSQRVIGIDLGSHSVKVAELDVSFRTASLADLKLHDLDAPQLPASVDASIEAVAGQPLANAQDLLTVGVPGDRVLMRVYDIPFKDPRKVQAVVGNELADDLPWEVDEVVFDQSQLVKEGKVLVAASRNAEVRNVLDQLEERGVEVRHLLVAPVCYAALAARLYPGESVAVIDLGHQRTNVCLVDGGRVAFARTLSRGGHQITEALAETLQLGYPEAENFKHSNACCVAGAADTDLDPVSIVTQQAIDPLVRELRQTLAVGSGKSGCNIERVVICGGTSQLIGLDAYLAAELQIPVEPIRLDSDQELAMAGLTPRAEVLGSQSLALALSGLRRDALDFRRGEFAFRAQTSVFRERAWTFLAWGVAIVIFALLSTIFTLRTLRKENVQLSSELSRATRAMLGKPVTDPEVAMSRVRRGVRGAASSGLSEVSAADVLSRLSRQMPSGEDVKLDLSKLDIRAGKTTLAGTVDSRGAVGKIIENLKKDACFKDVGSGKISDVGAGKKQFSLTIKTACF